MYCLFKRSPCYSLVLVCKLKVFIFYKKNMVNVKARSIITNIKNQINNDQLNMLTYDENF